MVSEVCISIKFMITNVKSRENGFVCKNFHPACVTTRWSGIGEKKKKKEAGHSGKSLKKAFSLLCVGNDLI